MLVHPSLPSPTGIAWSLWSWLKPKIYDHFEWNASESEDSTANTINRSFFVVLLLNNEDDTDTKLLRVPKVCTLGRALTRSLTLNSTGIRREARGQMLQVR